MEVLDDEYISYRGRLNLVDSEGYKYHSSLENIKKNFNRNTILARFFMDNPYTKENIQNYMMLNNINVEIYDFANVETSRDKIIFLCLNHNKTFERNWSDFKTTQNCDECRKESIHSLQSHSHEYIKNIIEFEYADWMKLKITDGCYYSNKTKLTISDIDGYKYFMDYAQISVAYKNKTKLSLIAYNPFAIENIKMWLINNNRTERIISNKFYEDEKVKLECINGHIFYMDFYHLQRGQGCKVCKGFRILTLEEIEIEFKEDDKILVADKYVNNLTKMPFICLKHKDKGIQHTNYVNFYSTKSKGCKYCYLEDISSINSKSHSDFLIALYNVCQSKFDVLEEYKGSNNEISIKCNICNHELTRSPKVLLRGGIECPNCEKHIRENHPNWSGGVTEIRNYLREVLIEWKSNSLINSDYKCYITGKNGSLNIHHAHPFKLILTEIFASTGLEIRPSIGDYTQEELNILKDKCLELHNKYGLGICMLKEVHRLFHSLYGYNCTPEDIDEFKTKYSNGEFDLPIAN